MKKEKEDQFNHYCDKIAKKADYIEVYQMAILRVAAQIIHDKYGDTHLAHEVHDLIPKIPKKKW